MINSKMFQMAVISCIFGALSCLFVQGLEEKDFKIWLHGKVMRQAHHIHHLVENDVGLDEALEKSLTAHDPEGVEINAYIGAKPDTHNRARTNGEEKMTSTVDIGTIRVIGKPTSELIESRKTFTPYVVGATTSLLLFLFALLIKTSAEKKVKEEALKVKEKALKELEETVQILNSVAGTAALFAGALSRLNNLDIAQPIDRLLVQAIDCVMPCFDGSTNKGMIFLIEGGLLILRAHLNMGGNPCIKNCATLSRGDGCYCPRVWETGKVIHSYNHDDATMPHGHFCIPIIYEGKITGVLNIYLARDYKGMSMSDMYVLMLGEAIGILIGRKKLRDDRERAIQEIEAKNKELEQYALYDTLTGLAKRRLLIDRLKHGIQLSRHHKRPITVFFIDLDKFKPVNDNYGHKAGDKILAKIAKRMLLIFRESDTVARLGGDEFVVVLPETSSTKIASKKAEELIDAIGVPFKISEGVFVNVGVSIGIVVYPWDGNQSPEQLLALADAALYSAKKAGGNRFRFHVDSPEALTQN